jgi:hypothetical protein
MCETMSSIFSTAKKKKNHRKKNLLNFFTRVLALKKSPVIGTIK